MSTIIILQIRKLSPINKLNIYFFKLYIQDQWLSSSKMDLESTFLITRINTLKKNFYSKSNTSSRSMNHGLGFIYKTQHLEIRVQNNIYWAFSFLQFCHFYSRNNVCGTCYFLRFQRAFQVKFPVICPSNSKHTSYQTQWSHPVSFKLPNF